MPVARPPRPAREDPELKREEQEKRLKKAADAMQSEMTGLVENYAETLEDIAKRDKKLSDLNKRLMKENAKHFSDGASAFADNAIDIEREVQALSDLDLSDTLQQHFKNLIGISERAQTASVSEIRELKSESLKTLSVLGDLAKVEGTEADVQDALKVGQNQLKLLKDNSGILDSINENIGSFMGSLSGAVVGVAASSPIGALGIQALVDHADNKKEEGRQKALFEIESVKQARKDNLDRENEAVTDFANDFADGTFKVLDRMGLADTQEEMAENIGEVVSRLEILNDTSKGTKSLLSSWLGGQEEERREALDRHRDMLEVLKGKKEVSKKEEDGSVFEEVLAANSLIGLAKTFGKALFSRLGLLFSGILLFFKKLIPNAVKFMVKQLPKLVLRFVALPFMIVGGLVQGIVDAWEKWKATGSIKDTIIAGLAGVIDFISLGFLDSELITNILNSIGDLFGTIVTDIKQTFNLHGSSFVEVLMDGLTKVGQFLYDNTIGKMLENLHVLGDLISESGFLDPVFELFDTMKLGIMDSVAFIKDVWGKTMTGIANGIDNSLAFIKNKWEATKKGMSDMFTWLGEIFTKIKAVWIDAVRRLPGMGNFLREAEQVEPDKQGGLRRAVELGAIDYDVIGNSEVMDESKLQNLTGQQLQDLLNFDDFNRDDTQKIQMALFEKGTKSPTDTLEFVQVRGRKRESVIQDFEKPEPKADTIERAVSDMAKQREQRRLQSEEQNRLSEAERAQRNSRSPVNISNSNSSVVNNIDMNKPYDTTQMFAISENRNRVN